MIHSMTGYGRAELSVNRAAANMDGALACYLVEVRSVNHRHLDLSVKCPRELLPLEPALRRVAGETLSRGRLEIFINPRRGKDGGGQVSADMERARVIMSELHRLQEELAVPGEVDMTALLSFGDRIFTEEAPEFNAEEAAGAVLASLRTAISELITMRAKEGDTLSKDMLKRITVVESALEEIGPLAVEVTKDYRKKLAQRIETLLERAPEPGRFEEEVAYFADRCDITEEIVRGKSHIAQFRKTVDEGGAAGKKLDFILQEISREINTIGSKANDSGIAALVISAKSELERVREQVQNIE